MPTISIVLPCKDESDALGAVLSDIRAIYPDAEILVVDDGSTDESAEIARAGGARVIKHPYSLGNGAAIKSGLRAARGDIVACMDSDGQHRAEDLPRLIEALDGGIDMVVGARNRAGQAGRWRSLANRIYNTFAGWMIGHRIPDLTSGFRVMRRDRAIDFFHLLPNGFSYPTTLTMAFFRAGYLVRYIPIDVRNRVGRSHISPIKDGIRFLLIIFKVGTLYSPLKIFFPLSVLLFGSGLGYYLFTYATQGRFTNMGALLFLSSIMTFLMGLVSEQITSLMYQGTRQR